MIVPSHLTWYRWPRQSQLLFTGPNPITKGLYVEMIPLGTISTFDSLTLQLELTVRHSFFLHCGIYMCSCCTWAMAASHLHDHRDCSSRLPSICWSWLQDPVCAILPLVAQHFRSRALETRFQNPSAPRSPKHLWKTSYWFIYRAIVTIICLSGGVAPPQLLSFTMLSLGVDDQADM